MSLQYTFEQTKDGNYICFLLGDFVAYTNHTDSYEVDQYLKEELGINSREEFLELEID